MNTHLAYGLPGYEMVCTSGTIDRLWVTKPLAVVRIGIGDLAVRYDPPWGRKHERPVHFKE